MHYRLIALFLAAAIIATPAKSDTASRIIVESEPAAAEIAPLPVGRRLIRLPTLEFALSVEPLCEVNMRAESISISVADTRETVIVGEVEDTSVVEVTLSIPRRQAPPLALTDFCHIAEDENLRSRELLVRDAFTAHLSLRCASDERQSVVYASQALDLTLRCKSANQDPSLDSTTR